MKRKPEVLWMVIRGESKEWTTWLSAVVACVAVLISLRVDDPVVPSGWFLTTGTAAFGIAGAALTLRSSLDQKADRTPYKEVLANTPGGKRAAMRPYTIVAIGSAIAGALACLGALAGGALSRWAIVVGNGVIAMALSWTVLSLVVLISLDAFHRNEADRLVALADADEMRERMERRGKGSTGSGAEHPM